MEKNFKLVIEYDGGAYHGWQSQKDEPTIQSRIEHALATMTRRNITLYGSGRTDAGVHALGQVAHFKCDTRLEADELKNGLNSLLPDDVVIRSCRRVHIDFHARYDAERKTYRYRILNRRLPAAIGRQYVWHVRSPLDIAVMQQCADLFKGTHAFDAFEGSGSPRASTIRTVFKAGWHREADDILIFEIEADGFLRFMVRNIVGTLVSAGLGKLTAEDVRRVLESRNRCNAPATAPAGGLFLVEVTYQPD
jgi:tRNA pseudouridine38-40 synthase